MVEEPVDSLEALEVVEAAEAGLEAVTLGGALLTRSENNLPGVGGPFFRSFISVSSLWISVFILSTSVLTEEISFPRPTVLT